MDLIGQQLPVEEGAWCHYPDEGQQELGLYPWADQMNGPWVVALGVGMMTHYTMAFCMRSLNATMPNWQNYLHGAMDGHPHMRIPPEFAKLLSGDHTTIVMQSNKMMIALYRMFSLQFLKEGSQHSCTTDTHTVICVEIIRVVSLHVRVRAVSSTQ